jgi:hypothetical protein
MLVRIVNTVTTAKFKFKFWGNIEVKIKMGAFSSLWLELEFWYGAVSSCCSLSLFYRSLFLVLCVVVLFSVAVRYS